MSMHPRNFPVTLITVSSVTVGERLRFAPECKQATTIRLVAKILEAIAEVIND